MVTTMGTVQLRQLTAGWIKADQNLNRLKCNFTPVKAIFPIQKCWSIGTILWNSQIVPTDQLFCNGKMTCRCEIDFDLPLCPAFSVFTLPFHRLPQYRWLGIPRQLRPQRSGRSPPLGPPEHTTFRRRSRPGDRIRTERGCRFRTIPHGVTRDTWSLPQGDRGERQRALSVGSTKESKSRGFRDGTGERDYYNKHREFGQTIEGD